MTDSLPSKTMRLFAHYEVAERGLGPSSSLVIARVLEEGDHEDLQWLASIFGESRLSAWFAAHSDRLLTRRSRSFWRVVLGAPNSGDPVLGESLWPL